ncbi:MAG: ABC transporter ATP-binding protein [Spirochaetales bacterium]|nr:ABC transporter ATP-binding protein [Spirochaetales bacterium]
MNDAVIELKDIRKKYRMGDIEVNALNGISMVIQRGEFVSVMGSSGSGKSTLMNILGCLDRPTDGEYLLEGINVQSLSGDEFARVRNRKIGFVFQVFNLLPRTTALENVELPLLYNREISLNDSKQKAMDALTRVGLKDRMYHEPNKLSGGQQQRVAIARALITSPSLILADEPTGNLDSRTSEDIMLIFKELNESGITIILVTHENDIASWAGRILFMKDGRITSDNAGKGHYRKNNGSLLSGGNGEET